MNKLEMKTLESSRLARMTTTERANHNRIKREILDARGNPRRLNVSMTVQLAGTIHKLGGTGEVSFKPGDPFDGGDVAIDFGELAAIATAPDAELIVDAWDKYTRGDVIRRSVIGDADFASLAYRGWIGLVKRPGDGTARDYVAVDGHSLYGRDQIPYLNGETIPDYIEPERLIRLINQGWIELAK